MAIPILGGIIEDVIGSVGDIVSEAIVDKDKKIAVGLELERLRDRANERVHEQMLAQATTNTEEAKHGSIFVAGWRPAVGWVCAAGLAAQVILLPLLDRIFHWNMPFDTELLILTLGGMLGIGGMRTYEKTKGVSTNDYRDVPDRPIGQPENVLPPLYAAELPEETPWSV
jgi:hypothetical protein